MDVIKGDGAARRGLARRKGFEVSVGRFVNITLNNIYVKRRDGV